MSNDRLVKAAVVLTSSLLLLNSIFFPPESTASILSVTHNHEDVDEAVVSVSEHDVIYTLNENQNNLLVEESFTVSQSVPEQNTILSFTRQFEHLGNSYELSYEDWELTGGNWELDTTDSHYHLILEDTGEEPQDFTLEYTLDGAFFANQYEGVSALLFPAVGWEYGSVENSSALLVGVPADSAVSCVPDCNYSPEPEGLLFTQTTSPMSLEVFFPPGTVNVSAVEGESLPSDEETAVSVIDDDLEPETSSWNALDSSTKMLLGGIVLSGLLSLLFTRVYFSAKRKRRKRKLEKNASKRKREESPKKD